MTTTETPRTDALSDAKGMFQCSCSQEFKDLSRQLERKLAKAEARVDHYAELINNADDKVLEFQAEVERLQANLRRAIEIAEELKTAIGYDIYDTELDQLKTTTKIAE